MSAIAALSCVNIRLSCFDRESFRDRHEAVLLFSGVLFAVHIER